MISTLQRMSTAPNYAATATLVLRNLKSWLDARRTRRALSDLTDEQLVDIGITRDQIDGIARPVAGR
ncbi:MAG: DUF1127 domain-containing protein [Mangrovicoccus sp.]|nr:DUF1127 domain-containing protein [Mangrovicoccus sp.]